MDNSSFTHTIYDGIDLDDYEYDPKTIRGEIEKRKKAVELAEMVMNDYSDCDFESIEEMNDYIQDYLDKRQKLEYLLMLEKTNSTNS